MQYILGFFETVLGVFGLLLSVLFAKFTPTGKTEWSIFYRGSFRNDDGTDALLSVTGDMIKPPFHRNADNGYLPVAKGQPGEALSPDQAIHVQILCNGTRMTRTLELAGLIDKPLRGYVEIMAERDGLRLRICKYTWGHSLSIGTGQQHRSVKTVAEKTVAWNSQPASQEEILATRLAFFNDPAHRSQPLPYFN